MWTLWRKIGKNLIVDFAIKDKIFTIEYKNQIMKVERENTNPA